MRWVCSDFPLLLFLLLLLLFQLYLRNKIKQCNIYVHCMLVLPTGTRCGIFLNWEAQPKWAFRLRNIHLYSRRFTTFFVRNKSGGANACGPTSALSAVSSVGTHDELAQLLLLFAYFQIICLLQAVVDLSIYYLFKQGHIPVVYQHSSMRELAQQVQIKLHNPCVLGWKASMSFLHFTSFTNPWWRHYFATFHLVIASGFKSFAATERFLPSGRLHYFENVFLCSW